METIYYWIGLLIFWLSAFMGVVLVSGFLLKIIIDELGRRFKILWVMVEFAHYRKEFKEWVKDKIRNKRAI